MFEYPLIDRYNPAKIQLLTGKSVLHVVCGEEHTVVLTTVRTKDLITDSYAEPCQISKSH